MKINLLDRLICPACTEGELYLTQGTIQNGAVEEGLLSCIQCGIEYPVRKGIPRLLAKSRSEDVTRPTQRTESSFGAEWQLFADETYKDMEHIRHFVETAWGKPASFAGKIIVDAGCGPGYFSSIFAEEAREVIALDLTDEGVAFTQSRIGHLSNVHVIQADLMNLPLKKGIADRISSTGVLHHTPNPYRCFSCLVSVLKPNGEIAISVYSKYPWPARLFYSTLRKLTTPLPPSAIQTVSRILVLFSYMPTKLLKWIAYPWAARWPRASYKRRLWWTYDWYSPEYVNFYSADEIKLWYTQQGLENFTTFPKIGGYYKGRLPGNARPGFPRIETP